MIRTTPACYLALIGAACALGIAWGAGDCFAATSHGSDAAVNLNFDSRAAIDLPRGLTAVDGVIGKAVRFSGSADCFLDGPSIAFSAPATVSAWVKIDRPRSDYRLITSLDGDKDQVGSIRFVGCAVQVWDGKAWQGLIPFIAVNGSWQHMAVVFGDDGTAIGYVNGQQRGSARCGFGFAGIKYGIGAALKPTSGLAFVGDMDDFRVYSHALSADDVRGLYPAKLFARAQREDGSRLTPLGKVALEESLHPVRPGIPGKQPFWNLRAQRFIYAPAFDIKPVEGAGSYRFTVTPKLGGGARQFEASAPTSALTPIWADVPAGAVSLKVEALDKPSGTVLGVAGTRDFIKSPAFNGPHGRFGSGYSAAGRKSLAAQFKQQRFQSWLTNNAPDGGCWYYHYASKMMGAVTAGMVAYAGICPDPTESAQALEIARRSADFLIGLTEKAPRPLAGWPPTYWTMPGSSNTSPDRILTFYPAEAAMSYLDLYDATRDAHYLEAAKAVADAYLRLQLKSGTWYQIIGCATGEPSAPNLLVPTYVVMFLDRLKDSYGLTQYEPVREKAFRWLMARPMRDYNWQGQFEDVSAMPPYEDLSRQEATEMSIMLFRASGKRPDYIPMAEELLRFAEDQFVVWDRRDALAGPNWAVPSALEQYMCYTPISYSNHSMVLAYMQAYQVTGNPIYHAKAVEMADTILAAQHDAGDGEIPTWMNYGAVPDNWVNCSVYPAITLIQLDKRLTQKPRGPAAGLR